MWLLKMSNKRYYWLKLMKDFFQQAKIKKLRRIAGGDTYVVIYLKMMLLSINSDGVIVFESIEPTLEEELALVLDEDVDNVKVLIAFLVANNLIEQKSESDFFMVEVSSLIGSESAAAERVRKHREKKKMLHCNTTVTDVKLIETNSNTEKEVEVDKEEEIKNKKEPKVTYEIVDNAIDRDFIFAVMHIEDEKTKRTMHNKVDEFIKYCVDNQKEYLDYQESFAKYLEIARQNNWTF